VGHTSGKRKTTRGELKERVTVEIPGHNSPKEKAFYSTAMSVKKEGKKVKMSRTRGTMFGRQGGGLASWEEQCW